MIHARADQEKNIKNAVADNISGYTYPESHLLQCGLKKKKKMGLYFFQILAGDRNSGNCRECADPFIWNAVYRRSNDWYFGMFSSDRRDKDHKRNAQKPFGKKKRTL